MSWTYTGDPSSSPLDEIRFLINDTVSTQSWTLSDEEIFYAAAKSPTNVLLAAAIAAEAILGKFAQIAQSKSVGDLSISYSNRHSQYKELARQLRARAALAAVTPYAGGLSWAEKRAQDADADRVRPAAKTDGMNQAAPLNTDSTTGL
jgi:hypothetical protein